MKKKSVDPPQAGAHGPAVDETPIRFLPNEPQVLGRLISAQRTAALLQIDRATLRRWRKRNIGPPFIRLGPKLIRYRDDDIKSYLDAQRRRQGEQI